MFCTYQRARRFFVSVGLGAAPFVITWHSRPFSDEKPLNVDPAHIETDTYHPIEISRVELRTSASSTVGHLNLYVHENIGVSDGAVGVFELR